MNRLGKLITVSAVMLAALTPAAVQASFTIGNLAVEQLATNLSSSTFSIVELNPYVSNAVPVNTIVIPSTGANALRQTSSASSGRIALTQDHTLLAFSGAQDGTGVADESTVLLRGVGTVDASGNYVLQTTYTGISGDQARSATSLDDKTWYMGDKAGIYTNGLATPANTSNVRPVKCFGGAVYALSQNSPADVVSSVSANGQTITGLPGLAVDSKALDFYMVASGQDGVTNDILYVNDGTTVTKYSLVAGSWVSNGSTALGVTADGMCAMYNGNGAYLYVTTGTNGSVIQVTDTTGYNVAPAITTANDVTLYTNALYLKGIDFAPVPLLATEQLAANSKSSTFSIVELNPYITNATPVNTVFIPSTGSSALRQGSSASTGRLALTQDRTLLAFTAAQDGVGVSDETTVNLRGVGTIDASGNYTLQTTYTGLGGNGVANQSRSATSLDDLTWYIGDKGGIYTNGTINPVNSTNVRPIKCFGGTLYVCAATTGSTPNVNVVNTLSTDATLFTPLPGLSPDSLALDFYMIASGVDGTNYDIIYVNDGANVTKYSLVSGSWTQNGTATALGVTADGLCALNIGGGAHLYVTTGAPGGVVEITDSAGWNQSPQINTAANIVLYTNAPYLKGIDFAPVKAVSTGMAALTPPVLTPAAGATVDASFNVTFTDSSAWRSAITNISVNSLTLSPSAYVVAAGQITFTPSASTLLQSSSTKTIAIGATGYSSDTVSQPLAAGAPVRLGIPTQPVAPTGDGGTLVTQPVVAVQDQYGNGVNSGSLTFTATVGSGAWNFGTGSGLTQTAVNGTAMFTNLSATSAGAVSSAVITFTVSGSGLGGLPSTTTNAAAFAIPAPATAFTAGNLAVEQEDLATKNSTFSILELSPTISNQSTPVNTFPIPATGTNALRQASSGSTGRLADSDDGTLLCFSGALCGDSTVADATTVDPRGGATLNPQGTYTLQATYIGLGDATANQTRSCVSADDTNWYMGDKGGVYVNGDTGGNAYVAFSQNNPANVRSLKSFGGTIFVMQQEGGSDPLSPVVSILPDPLNAPQNPLPGAPANGSQDLFPLEGFTPDGTVLDFYMLRSGNNGSMYDYAYYIDGTNTTSGAIFKFFYTGQIDSVTGEQEWQSAGNSWLTPNGGDGLCARTNSSGGVDLYYTTGDGGSPGNSVVTVHDSAAWNQPINMTSMSKLYTVGAQATLKGIAFAPMTTNSLVAPITPFNITPGSSSYTGAPGSGAFGFSFTNAAGLSASFTILETTNVALPLSQWQVLGHPTEGSPGMYSFSDTSATNGARFYIIHQP